MTQNIFTGQGKITEMETNPTKTEENNYIQLQRETKSAFLVYLLPGLAVSIKLNSERV